MRKVRMLVTVGVPDWWPEEIMVQEAARGVLDLLRAHGSDFSEWGVEPKVFAGLVAGGDYKRAAL